MLQKSCTVMIIQVAGATVHPSIILNALYLKVSGWGVGVCWSISPTHIERKQGIHPGRVASPSQDTTGNWTRDWLPYTTLPSYVHAHATLSEFLLCTVFACCASPTVGLSSPTYFHRPIFPISSPSSDPVRLPFKHLSPPAQLFLCHELAQSHLIRPRLSSVPFPPPCESI